MDPGGIVELTQLEGEIKIGGGVNNCEGNAKAGCGKSKQHRYGGKTKVGKIEKGRSRCPGGT